MVKRNKFITRGDTKSPDNFGSVQYCGGSLETREGSRV